METDIPKKLWCLESWPAVDVILNASSLCAVLFRKNFCIKELHYLLLILMNQPQILHSSSGWKRTRVPIFFCQSYAILFLWKANSSCMFYLLCCSSGLNNKGQLMIFKTKISDVWVFMWFFKGQVSQSMNFTGWCVSKYGDCINSQTIWALYQRKCKVGDRGKEKVIILRSSLLSYFQSLSVSALFDHPLSPSGAKRAEVAN